MSVEFQNSVGGQMADEIPAAKKTAELKQTATNLVEIGLGASRRNDSEAAHIYLGVAATLFERAHDSASAQMVRGYIISGK